MKKYQLLNTKIIAVTFALLGIFTVNGFAQSSPMIVQMELSISENAENIQQAATSFEMGGNKISNPAKNLKIEGNSLSFSTDFQGAEIRFTGILAENKLPGTLEVVEKNKKVAAGTWSLMPVGGNQKNIAGIWKGAFTRSRFRGSRQT